MSSSIQNLTEGKIFSTLLKLALPLMGTSFVQMAYNLMAMFWVGRLGSEEEAAIGAIGMLSWLTNSVAILVLIGSEVSVGQSIGAKKIHRAIKFASNTSTIAIGLGIIWALIYFIFSGQILSFFKLTPSITCEASLYLRILAVSIPFQFLTLCFCGIYNGAGRSSVPFRLNSSGLLINMIIDPFLIFGLGPFPQMGIHGAAVGTVISQLYVCSIFIYKTKFVNAIIGNFPLIIRPQKIYVSRIFSLGTPVSVMNSLYALINMNLARVASIFGKHLGLMTQTVGGQVEGVTWMTSQGFSTALSAFIAQNYAAGKLERAKKAYMYAIALMISFGIVVSLIFLLFGGSVFSIIIPEEKAIQAGAEYLSIMGMVQVFMMMELMTQGMFNGVGKTLPPALISIIFNALRIPLAYILASQMGIIGVWWAMAISTICKGIILPVWFSLVYRKLHRKEKMSR